MTASLTQRTTLRAHSLVPTILSIFLNLLQTAAVFFFAATVVPAFLKSWFILRHEPFGARKCSRFELDLKLQEAGARGQFFSTVEEEEMSITNKGDQDLNSVQTMSDRHSLYEILERKAECAIQGEKFCSEKTI